MTPYTPKPLASWFPHKLHTFRFGDLNLFEIVAGSEKNLGSNQLELKKWIRLQAEKHIPLRFRAIMKMPQNLSREQLAGKIMEHIKTGAGGVFFPLSLPAEYLIGRVKNRQSKISWLKKLQHGACFLPRTDTTALT